MTRVLVFYLCLIYLFSSCQQPPASESTPPQDGFFDLKAYFSQEIDKLKLHSGFEKTTQINKITETHRFDSLDFSKELAMFINADINRITWLDKYQVDSSFTNQRTLKSITYRALSPKMKTQKLHLTFSEDVPDLIQIEQLTTNALMNASMNLEYVPGKSYQIKSKQKLRLSEEKEMIVRVEFL